MRGFLLVSIYNFNIVIRRVKLKRVLDRAECAAVIPKARLSVFLGGHRRILKPALLMRVVYPTADDIVIRKLRNGIGNVSAAILAVSRHGERGNNIVLRYDSEKARVVIVGFGSQRMVGRCISLAAAVA